MGLSIIKSLPMPGIPNESSTSYEYDKRWHSTVRVGLIPSLKFATTTLRVPGSALHSIAFLARLHADLIDAQTLS